MNRYIQSSLWTLCIGCMAFLGCTTNTTPAEKEQITEETATPVSEPSPPQPSTQAPSGSSDYYDHANIEPVPNRDTRRLSIRALKRSLYQTTGVEWLENGESPFDTFASSLGIPDYAQSVAEDLDPGVMFYKQLIAAATYSCEAMVNADLELPLAERKLLHNISEESSDPTQVKTAIMKALVRFHGEEENLDPNDPLVLKWYNLWSGLHERQPVFDSGLLDEQEACLMSWQIVCEALILSPKFYTY